MTNEAAVVIERGDAPLILSMPHVGTEIPAEMEARLVSPWLARRDTDWHLNSLYDFARAMGATIVRATMSRTVIDLNRDPAGASLYPGMTTTALCPVTSFDGEPLYGPGGEPDDIEIDDRRRSWFAPFHRALTAEIDRLRAEFPTVVLYDCHSIRSEIPTLFPGRLPQFNIGTNSGRSCSAELTEAILRPCAESGLGHVVDGRFKGGWITRHYGRPDAGIHAVQMELAMRGYMREPTEIDPTNWPTTYDPDYATPLTNTLRRVLKGAIAFAKA